MRHAAPSVTVEFRTPVTVPSPMSIWIALAIEGTRNRAARADRPRKRKDGGSIPFFLVVQPPTGGSPFLRLGASGHARRLISSAAEILAKVRGHKDRGARSRRTTMTRRVIAFLCLMCALPAIAAKQE